MDYHSSTQARAWMFERDSLSACKQCAVATTEETAGESSSVVRRHHKVSKSGAQKFASGFHASFRALNPSDSSIQSTQSDLSVGEHDLLVQFHAHQIQTLIGPTAIIRELRTSETVLSTAAIFFRRFYLSNSILLIHPRNIAVACAFLAAKVEEERVQVRTMPRSSFQRGKARSAGKPTRKCQQNFTLCHSLFQFLVLRFFCLESNMACVSKSDFLTERKMSQPCRLFPSQHRLRYSLMQLLSSELDCRILRIAAKNCLPCLCLRLKKRNVSLCLASTTCFGAFTLVLLFKI